MFACCIRPSCSAPPPVPANLPFYYIIMYDTMSCHVELHDIIHQVISVSIEFDLRYRQYQVDSRLHPSKWPLINRW